MVWRRMEKGEYDETIAGLSDAELFGELTDRMRQFVETFLLTLSKEQAKAAAGYHASNNYNQIMDHPIVKEIIRRRFAETTMKADEVILRLTRIARVNVGDFYIVDGNKARLNWEMIQQNGDMISGLEPSRYGYKVRLWDKTRALEMLAKHLGLFEADNVRRIEDSTLQKFLDKFMAAGEGEM